jgi:hypothetical protein
MVKIHKSDTLGNYVLMKDLQHKIPKKIYNFIKSPKYDPSIGHYITEDTYNSLFKNIENQ